MAFAGGTGCFGVLVVLADDIVGYFRMVSYCWLI